MSEYITININITIDKDKEEDFYQSLDDNLIINSWELPIAKQKYKQEIEELQERRDELSEENEKLKEELDKYLNQEEEEIRQLNNDNKLDDILSAISKANAQMAKEIKYKQALDEIEHQVTELFLGVENKDRTYCEKILDIINSVKDIFIPHKEKDGE
nr:MAG TPA: nuclear pore complex protein [Caudoviricetes sp.]